MTKNTNVKIISLSVAIAVELIVLLFFMDRLGFFSKKFDERICYDLPEFVGIGPGMGDTNIFGCVGHINIEQSNSCEFQNHPYICGNVYIEDALHLSPVNKVESFKIMGNFVYVIGNLSYDVYDTGERNGTVSVYIPMNGKLQFVYFDGPNDIPHYFKISGETGDMTLYNNFGEMNDTEKAIFNDLEKNKKDYMQEFRSERAYLVFYLIAGPLDFLLLVLTVFFLVLAVRNKKHE